MSDTEEFKIGDKVTGKVVKVDEEQVFVDIGYKSEGIIPLNEISNLHVENPADFVQEGDEVTLLVKSIDDEEIVLSKKVVDAEKAWEDLQEKYDNEEIFETTVKEVVKGGLVVDVGLRGFIPASLVETYFVEDFSSYKDKSLLVKVTDIDKDQNRIILSHRAVVEEEQQKEKKEKLQTLAKGDVIEGTVQRIATFGAFVDIGGIDGLVHISELDHSRVENVSDVLEEGQVINVEVLSVDQDSERVSLSYKNTLPGPWTNIGERIKEGENVQGVVKRLVDFGAFVEIEKGVEGLIHISQIANRHIGTPHEVLEVGQEVTAKVLSVSESEKRISLSMKEIELEEEQSEIEQYGKEDDDQGFSLGDMIGDKLDQYKNE